MKHSINVDGVTYYREPPDLTKAKEVVEKYSWLCSHIASQVEETRSMCDEYAIQGLSVSLIQAEAAYLTALKIGDMVKHIDQHFDTVRNDDD